MLQYYLIDLKNINKECLPILEKAFDLWKTVWDYELSKHGEVAHVEEFSRSEILAVIVDHLSQSDFNIVAFHLYTGWNLNFIHHSYHPYFTSMPEQIINDIKNTCASTMSMEYLTVAEKYRKKISNIAFAEIIINLGLMVMNNSAWNSIIGTSRIDRKVDKMGERFGCKSLDNIKKYDYECKINFVKKGDWSPPKDDNILNLTNHLWVNKKNYTQLIKETEQNKNKGINVTKQHLIEECERLVSESNDLIKDINWGERSTYVNWLSQAISYVELSTRFLHLVAGKMPLNRQELFKRFSQHVSEELGHERLLINDLKNMGSERLPPFNQTTNLVEFQKDQINNHNPLFHFGYILYLENLAVKAGNYVMDSASKSHGKNTVSFLKVHANEDEDHIKSAYSALDLLDQSEYDGVLSNMLVTANLYKSMLDSCRSQTNSLEKNNMNDKISQMSFFDKFSTDDDSSADDKKPKVA